MTEVIVTIGAGSIGQAITRLIGSGKHLLVADLRPEHAETAAEVLHDAGFDVTTATVDVASDPQLAFIAQPCQIMSR